MSPAQPAAVPVANPLIEAVARAIAPRLAAMVEDSPVVVLSVPPECLPVPVATEMLRVLVGEDFVHCGPDCS